MTVAFEEWEREGCLSMALTSSFPPLLVQSTPLNGSPDNGSGFNQSHLMTLPK